MKGLSSILLSTASAASLLGVLIGATLVALPAHADKVGVAAAVNPDAFSSLSGAPQSQLNIGKSIFYNERINTTTSGLVQVLLVDGSTFTVGPGSNLVIDKFVYNPKKQTGQVVASFSKGVMRYVGGKISKNEDAVKVKTPAGTLAIRGGMFQGSVNGNKGIFSFLYGNAMTFTGKNGQTYTVYQPGYTLDLTSGTPKIRPTTAADIKTVMSGLTNSNTGGIGSSDGDNPGTQQQLLAETISLQDLISDAATDRITDEIAQQEQDDELTPSPTPDPDPTPDPPGPPPPPKPPAPVDLRVLGSGVEFVSLFNYEGKNFDRLVGGSHGTTVNLPAKLTGCADGICPVTNAVITQNQQPAGYWGIASTRKDFVAFQLAPDSGSGDPFLVVGGKGYTFEPQSGRLHRFQLGKDILNLDGFGPFASGESTIPPGGTGFVSPLMLLEKDSPSSEGGAVWLQASLMIDGEGSSQSSIIDLALGEWDPLTGMTGHRRGGSTITSIEAGQNPTADQTTNQFDGEIASISGPDGAHFLGSNGPNVVLGVSSPNERRTDHVGLGRGSIEGPTQTNRDDLIGYAAGLASGAGDPNILASSSSDGVTLRFNAEANTMEASLKVGDGLLQNPRYNLEFGGAGRSAYIENDKFAAIETDGSSVSEEYIELNWRFPFVHVKTHLDENPEVQGYIVSSGAIGANEVLFPMAEGDEIQKQAFCDSCDFIRWGAWGSDITYQNHSQNTVNQNVQLGWWIAGSPVKPSDMPTTNSATYKGDVIGNVASRNGQVWNQYVATGDLLLVWNFRRRTGDITIDNFDNKKFTGSMSAARGTPHIFSGPLTGSGTIGAASGTFVGPDGIKTAPRGVIGDFGVAGSGYRATGIFGGTKAP